MAASKVEFWASFEVTFFRIAGTLEVENVLCRSTRDPYCVQTFCSFFNSGYFSCSQMLAKLIFVLSFNPLSPRDKHEVIVMHTDRAEKQLRVRHWRPSRPISFEIAQSARHLARKYRLE